MKNLIFPAIAACLCMGGSLSAQKNQDNTYASNPRVLSTKPATVNGDSEEVVFGKVPLLETKHALEGNTDIEFEGQQYFYNKGDYFIYNGGRFLLVMPPVGITVKSLPDIREEVGDSTYYYKGIFYRKTGSGFETIKHPQGAVIYNLPEMTDVVTVGDEAYYEYLGVLYKRAFVEGEQAFEVVGELNE